LAVLGKHGIEHVAHELLAGLGQLGDGIELLFEERDRPTACAARRGGRDPGLRPAMSGKGNCYAMRPSRRSSSL